MYLALALLCKTMGLHNGLQVSQCMNKNIVDDNNWEPTTSERLEFQEHDKQSLLRQEQAHILSQIHE